MHVPDNFICAEVNIATAAVSAGVVGAALLHGRKTLDEKQVPLLGGVAAFVFAAQMLNFKVAEGTSGHFLGAMLAAILLGPLNACMVMALVLLVQCFGFVDGGLTALGSNIFNMGVVAGIGGYWIFRSLLRLLPQSRVAFVGASLIASWASVVLASAACALELVISGRFGISEAMPAMTSVHALIGVGEALITGAMVSLVLALRPDLVKSWNLPGTRLAGSIA